MWKTIKNNIDLPEWIFRSVFLIFFFLKIFEALLLHPHGDALYYHLAGPKIALEQGLIELHNFLPWFQTGVFDYIYFPIVFLFGAGMVSQILGQLMHLSVGLLLPSLLAYRFHPLAGLAILTINKSSDFFLYAKNDGAMAAFYFTFLVLVVLPGAVWEKKSALFKGIFLGLIPAIKFSGVFYFTPVYILLLFRLKGNFREMVFLSIGVFISLSPILVRNYIFVGNPFFPGLIKIFPGNLTPSMIEYYLAHMGARLNFSLMGEQLRAFWGGKIIFWIAPLLWFRDLKNKKLPLLILLPLLSFFLYLIVNGGVVYERYYFAAYMVLALYVVTYLNQFLLEVPKLSLKNAIGILILIIILVDSKADKAVARVVRGFSLYADFLSGNISREVLLEKTIPQMVILQGLPENTPFLTDQLSQFFYAPRGVRPIQYSAQVEAEFLGRCSLDMDLKNLEKFNYAILGELLSNECTQYIREHWMSLKHAQEYTLFKRVSENE